MGSKIKPVVNYEGKKNRRLGKWIATLSKDQRQLLTEYCVIQTESDLILQFQAYERVLRPALYTLADNDVIEAEKILAEIIRQVGIEGVTLNNFRRREDYMKVIDEVKDNVVSEYVMRKANNEKEKDIIESIWAKYPKLSRNAVKNIILEHKRDEKKNELNINSSDDAVKYIFEEDEVVEKPEVTGVVEAESEDPDKAEEKIEEIKSEENSKFKVLNKRLIVDVEGAHGIYHIENGIISCIGDGSDTAYSSEEAVKHAFSEKLEIYAKQLDREQSEMIEVMNMYK
ncbi:hypothetical protein AB2T85_01965 [Clostridium butyricum]|uniref:hypothetical protein n=1 Tax=Clostridium butyricum TaxID=1492 RepID=UPI003467AA43